MSKKSKEQRIARAAQAIALSLGKAEPSYHWALNVARQKLASGDTRPVEEIAEEIAKESRE